MAEKNTAFWSPVNLPNVLVKLELHIIDVSVIEAAKFLIWWICNFQM